MEEITGHTCIAVGRSPEIMTEVITMTTSRNHQEAHGIGQIEEQLQQQANAIDAIQGGSETDRNIAKETNRDVHTSLDEVFDIGEREV
ncbi:hypothetical protein D3C76_875840 [compost metagenome]